MPCSPASILVDAEGAAQVAAQRPSIMSENCSLHDAQECSGNRKPRGVCDKWLVGLVLLTLARAGEALAGEQPVLLGDAQKPDFGDSRAPLEVPRSTATAMAPIPAAFQSFGLPEIKTYPAEQFRPRGRSIFDTDSREASPNEAPMLRGTTVWQRLSDYRSHDRVRLLTLWETGGSTVSLQAGKKGSPSLQWTSRLMNHGGATRGLLDKVVAATLAGAGSKLHFGPRTTVNEPLGKPSKLAESSPQK
jgi:hypothetical protein